MANIPGYEAGVRPSGTLEARASGQQFGSGIGAGLQDLGGAVEDFAKGREQMRASQDAQDIHQLMADERLKQTQKMEAWAAQAKPGDDQAVRDFSDKIGSDVDASGFKPRTRAGQQMLQSAKIGLFNDMSQRAAARMAAITAAGAAQDHKVFVDKMGLLVTKDPAQITQAFKSIDDYIGDPVGLMSKIPAPQREAYRKEAKEQVAALQIRARISTPEGAQDFLHGIAPDIMTMYDPFSSILKAGTATGGKLNVSEKTMAVVPQAAAAAASVNINTNVVLASVDAANPPDPVAYAKQSAEQLSKLLERYGGDYGKALAAQKLGVSAVDQALVMDGSNWMQSIPQEAAKHVETVMTNAGLMPADQPAPGTTPSPAVPEKSRTTEAPATGDIALDSLPAEMRYRLIPEAMHILDLKIRTDDAAKRRAKELEAEAEDKAMGVVIAQINDPAKNGSINVRDILENPVLKGNWKLQQHAIDLLRRVNDERQARAENRTNPGAVRELELRIMAEEGDPRKIYNMEPIMDYFRAGRISFREMVALRNEVTMLKDGAYGGFMGDVKSALATVHTSFMREFRASLPGGARQAADAYYRFERDLKAKIQAKREKNEDPRVLLDPASPEWAMKPERINAFWPELFQETMSNEAGKVLQKQDVQQPAGGFVVGNTYTINGKKLTYKGGPANLKTSWSE